MLDYSELTVVKNSDGIATALGYPINSFLLQNNKVLFVGGGRKDNLNLAVPAGLVCMTQTICRPANEMGSNAYEMGANEDDYVNSIEDERDIVPEGLYERLLELAEVKEKRKMTKKKKDLKKNKTHKRK